MLYEVITMLSWANEWLIADGRGESDLAQAVAPSAREEVHAAELVEDGSADARVREGRELQPAGGLERVGGLRHDTGTLQQATETVAGLNNGCGIEFHSASYNFV